ncbi:MAG TPA: hypothetical protein VF624_08350 [Tepidisphaeraceae bacterium]
MAGPAPTDVQSTRTRKAGPVHCSVWLCDCPRPPEYCDCLGRSDLDRFGQRGRAEVIPYSHACAQVDQQLDGLRVILYRQVVKRCLSDAGTHRENLGMIRNQLSSALGITDRELHQLDEKRIPCGWSLLSHNGPTLNGRPGADYVLERRGPFRRAGPFQRLVIPLDCRSD